MAGARTAVLLGVLAAGCGREPAPEPESVAAPAVVEAVPEASLRLAPVELRVLTLRALDHFDLSKVTRLDLALSDVDAAGMDSVPEARCVGPTIAELGDRLPALRSLRISGCVSVLDAGFGSLGTRLRELELADLALGPGLAPVLSGLTVLSSLDLTRVASAAPVVAVLIRMPLQALALRDLPPGDPSRSWIGTLAPTVETLRLEGGWVQHVDLVAVAKAVRLTGLALVDAGVGNFSLNQVKALTALTRLELVGPSFNDQTPLYLRDLPIERFSCTCGNLRDGGLRALRGLERLQELDLPESRATSSGLAHLAALAALRTLRMKGLALDPIGVQALSRLRQLRTLELAGPEIAVVEPGLDEMPELESLSLRYPTLDDATLEALGGLPRLRRLDLSGTAVSDAGLVALGRFPGLIELSLRDTRVTNRGLSHVGQRVALEVLDLSRCEVVDEGLARLAELRHLRELRLGKTLVTDRAVETLMRFPALERLDLSETVVSAVGAARLSSVAGLDLQGSRADPAVVE